MVSEQPVFVSVETSPYSGATLLAMLAGVHPQLATVGEMSGLIASEDPDVYLCSCGQRIRECVFWHSVGEAMRKRGHSFDVAHFDLKFALDGSRFMQVLRTGSSRNPFVDGFRDLLLDRWPHEVRQQQALVRRNVAFVEAVLEVTGKSAFLDTSKDRLRLKSLYRHSALDVRAIHLVRDVRGVVASYLRHHQGIDAREAARRWVRAHLRLETSLRLLPAGKRMVLRYEDLCSDVGRTLEGVYRFCEVDPGATPVYPPVTQHIVGNKMRLKELRAVSLDERWKTDLSKEQMTEITQIAGRLSRKYGYEGAG